MAPLKIILPTGGRTKPAALKTNPDLISIGTKWHLYVYKLMFCHFFALL